LPANRTAPAGALDEALLEATPLTARRLAHWGPGGEAFARAYLARNPDAELSLLGERPPPAGLALDAVAAGARPEASVLAALAAGLRPGGDLVARWGEAGAAEALAQARLEPRAAPGAGLVRAKTPPGPGRPPLHLEIIGFAHKLMDVRTRLPARALASDPELTVRYGVPPHAPLELPAGAPKALLLQRPRPVGLEQQRAQLAHFIARGWLMLIEYDDHPGLVAETLGRPFGPGDLDRFGWFHAVQTSVEPLAELFRQVNPEVRVLPNAVFDLAPAPAGPPPRRVFYGALSRGRIGVEVARSLGPVTQAFPDVEFRVLGDQAVFDALPTANKALEPYLPYEAYLARMAGCAVSLSPVEPSDTRAAKSDAKFLDAARAGLVTIGSPVVYGRAIRHGENGLLAERVEDWAPLLHQALADPAATRAMGRRAWDEVRASRMFAGQVAPHRDWLHSLWDRREALDAALFARVPGLAQAVAAERARLGGRKEGVEPGGP
jgi:hypothetical protein